MLPIHNALIQSGKHKANQAKDFLNGTSSNVPMLVEAAYSSQSENNTIVWESIDRVDDEVLGSELCGATFDSDLDGFSGANWAYSEGYALHTPGVTTSLTKDLSLEVGKLYKIQWEIKNRTWGYIRVCAGTAKKDFVSLNGTYTDYLVCIGDSLVRFNPNSDFNGGIDNISVKKVTSGTIIGTARVPSLYDLTGHGKHLAQATETAQMQLDSETGVLSTDGTDEYAMVELSHAPAWVYPSDQCDLNGTTLTLGKSGASFAEHSLKGLITCRRTPTALEQAEILNWYNSVIDPVQQLVNHVSQSKDNALAYLQSKDPVALWVPGMQEDGKRVDGDTIYLTQLTDLSGNGNHAVQATDTAQAYLDGSDAVFSGGQWYDAMGNFADKPYTICTGIKPNLVQDHMGIWSLSSNNKNDYYEAHITNSVTGSSYLMTRINDSVNSIDSNNADFIDGQLHATIVNFGSTGRFFMVNGITTLEDSFTGSPVGDLVRMSCGSLTRYEARTDYLNGGISSQAIYNKALTTSEQTIVNQCLTTLGA
jgi:hypothetical protein